MDKVVLNPLNDIVKSRPEDPCLFLGDYFAFGKRMFKISRILFDPSLEGSQARLSLEVVPRFSSNTLFRSSSMTVNHIPSNELDFAKFVGVDIDDVAALADMSSFDPRLPVEVEDGILLLAKNLSACTQEDDFFSISRFNPSIMVPVFRGGQGSIFPSCESLRICVASESIPSLTEFLKNKLFMQQPVSTRKKISTASFFARPFENATDEVGSIFARLCGEELKSGVMEIAILFNHSDFSGLFGELANSMDYIKACSFLGFSQNQVKFYKIPQEADSSDTSEWWNSLPSVLEISEPISCLRVFHEIFRNGKALIFKNKIENLEISSLFISVLVSTGRKNSLFLTPPTDLEENSIDIFNELETLGKKIEEISRFQNLKNLVDHENDRENENSDISTDFHTFQKKMKKLSFACPAEYLKTSFEEISDSSCKQMNLAYLENIFSGKSENHKLFFLLSFLRDRFSFDFSKLTSFFAN